MAEKCIEMEAEKSVIGCCIVLGSISVWKWLTLLSWNGWACKVGAEFFHVPWHRLQPLWKACQWMKHHIVHIHQLSFVNYPLKVPSARTHSPMNWRDSWSSVYWPHFSSNASSQPKSPVQLQKILELALSDGVLFLLSFPGQNQLSNGFQYLLLSQYSFPWRVTSWF